jgi:hypothetical protein
MINSPVIEQEIKMASAIRRVRDLHSPTQDGRSCVECSRLVASVTDGKGSAQFPCFTILFLDGDQ